VDDYVPIMQLEAEDGDRGFNREIRYYIVDGLFSFVCHLILNFFTVSVMLSLLLIICRSVPASQNIFCLLKLQLLFLLLFLASCRREGG